jgi:hypothetical protein
MARLYNRAPPTGLFGAKLQWGVALLPQYWQHCRDILRRLIDIHGTFSGFSISTLNFQLS